METLPVVLAATVVLLGVLSALASGGPAHRTAAALKMTAATGYLLLALVAGAWDSGYGRAVLGALLLCWLGDLLLIAPGRGKAFLGGLVSFLLGHLTFAVAFWLHGVTLPWAGVGGVAAGTLGVGVAVWLSRHDVPARMRTPVHLYIAVITLMVAMALGSRGAGGSWMIPAGAVAFMVSDIFVARERFVTTADGNVRFGLPLYFLAQVLLALTV